MRRNALRTMLSPPRSVIAIVATAAFIACFDNGTLWHEVWGSTPGTAVRWHVSIGCFAILLATLNVFFIVTAVRRSLKPVLIVSLLLSAALGFLMSEHVLLTDFAADRRELRDLVALSLARHVGLFGIAPSILIALMPLGRAGWGRELAHRAGLVIASIAALLAVAAVSQPEISAFAHRSRRALTLVNPGYPIYALVRTIRRAPADGETVGSEICIPGAVCESAAPVDVNQGREPWPAS